MIALTRYYNIIRFKERITQMTNSIEFGKKINRRPIMISLILSLIAGGIGAYFDFKLAISLFLLVLIFMLFIYYPNNLSVLFGHWQVEKHGISYYKMDSYFDRLKMTLLPDITEFQFISFSQVKSYYVIEQKEKFDLTNILTINPTRQSIFPWLRKPFYLVLVVNGGQIKLDLSWTQLHDRKNSLYRLSNALKVIDQKIN
ncbi:hypothetical protein FC67_GL001662 [Companilactobacillus alimentarius DSM 20249]|nr:hypothetical protein FC67_GL001662 [Companilactobacillus alimentarius DSM 20249]